MKHEAAIRMNRGQQHLDVVRYAERQVIKVQCAHCGASCSGPLATTRVWFNDHAATHGVNVIALNEALQKRRKAAGVAIHAWDTASPTTPAAA